VIESKQDKSENKDSTYGGGFSIDLANPSNFSANINGSKGNGEKDWVNKQSSLIAKNGGKIDTENLTNIGAVIGSESETNKLKVSANKVVVKDLEDKNKYENIGGGIAIGTDVPNVSVKHDKIDKEQINRATALNTDFEVAGQKVKAEDLGFNTNKDKAQEVTKDEERHLDAELHTDLLGKDKQEELKKAGGIISDLTTALGNKGKIDASENKGKTEGNFLERYKQLSMVRAIGDQVEKNPEYLSILDKKAIKNGKIDDKTQVEKVSVMNKLLNDALRAKGYAGPDIKMVLTDVKDPNGPFYTDTLTNTVVFDRKMLASLDRDKILNILGHEFGHYSKEDNKTGNQTIANYSGDKLEDRTKAMVSKEATEDTLASIRNNPNVITGEEGRLLAESIPIERREYKAWVFNNSVSFMGPNFGIGFGQTYALVSDDNTGEAYFALILNGKMGRATSPSLGFDFSYERIDEINKPEEFNTLSLEGNASVGIPYVPYLQAEVSVNINLIGKKNDPIEIGFSGSYEPKKINKYISKYIESAKIQEKLGPVTLSGSLNGSLVILKKKIETKESKELHSLNLKELEINERLKDRTLSEKQRISLEIEKNRLNQEMGRLVEKMKSRFDIKIPEIDSDAWD